MFNFLQKIKFMNPKHLNTLSLDHKNLSESHEQADGTIYKFNLDEALVLKENDVQEALKNKNVKLLLKIHNKFGESSNADMMIAKIISKYLIEELTNTYMSSKFNVNQENEFYNLLLEKVLTYFQLYNEVFTKTESYQEVVYSDCKKFLKANLIPDTVLSKCIDEVVKKYFNGEKKDFQEKLTHTFNLVMDEDNFIEVTKNI